MTRALDLGTAPLTVVLDPRHPLAYLALHPTIAFADSLGIAVDWLPLAVPTLNPPSTPGLDDDRGVRHRRSRAEAIRREIDTYAAAQGLMIRDPYRDPDASAAHLGWLWMRECRPDRLPAHLVALFRAYWSQALDPSSLEQVATLVEATGGSAADFLAWSRDGGVSASENTAREIRDAGLHQVPAYWVEGEVFYGRQHLPMIRWILEGRSGAVPI